LIYHLRNCTLRTQELILDLHMFIFKTRIFFIFLSLVSIISSCTTIDLYEKVVPIPDHEWHSSFKPQFTFTIKDTTSPYQVFIILRHNDKYNYNNIWLNLYTKGPGDTIQKAQYELALASADKGWMGSAMDDLYEHRIALTPNNQKLYFKKPGQYTFSVEQIMREDPLENVLDVGLRIEKKPQ
jgi:gliding motility-associated lipoprotein GldH